MSGHSKWATIKRKKAATDAKRGKIFTKLIREITVAARDGGGDPNFNPRLRLAVETAKAGNMPSDNITRAIKKGTGDLEGVSYEEIIYEGYGPGGVALYIEALTDNQNRTVADIRHILTKHSGSLGTAGSVGWQFDRKGMIYLDGAYSDEETVFDLAIEAGADDVVLEDEQIAVITDVEQFHGVQEHLKESSIGIGKAELSWVPKNEILVNADDAKRLLRIIEDLEDSDDVQQVSSNADFDENILDQVI
jgi:YebC/PmpR family DNA-binding regulatory protein